MRHHYNETKTCEKNSDRDDEEHQRAVEVFSIWDKEDHS